MSAVEEQEFIAAMQRVLNFPHRVEITIVDEIPRSASGKFKNFVSLIKN
jgi:phenylacetate-coenzyme A ligase PaaK-like adenylate-forming protein